MLLVSTGTIIFSPVWTKTCSTGFDTAVCPKWETSSWPAPSRAADEEVLQQSQPAGFLLAAPSSQIFHAPPIFLEDQMTTKREKNHPKATGWANPIVATANPTIFQSQRKGPKKLTARPPLRTLPSQVSPSFRRCPGNKTMPISNYQPSSCPPSSTNHRHSGGKTHLSSSSSLFLPMATPDICSRQLLQFLACIKG